MAVITIRYNGNQKEKILHGSDRRQLCIAAEAFLREHCDSQPTYSVYCVIPRWQRQMSMYLGDVLLELDHEMKLSS